MEYTETDNRLIKTQQFWDKQANKYDAAEIQFASVYKDIIVRTRKYLTANDHVLDFGCATGTKTLQLADGVNHIHGLDFSAEMIKEAVKKKDNTNVQNISFSQGTIYDEKLKSVSFDSIIAYGILHLLVDKEKAVRRIFELLKPGGLFISTTACFKEKMAFRNRLEFTAFVCSKRLGISPLHLNMFSAGDVKELMVHHGFQLIEAEKLFTGISSVFCVARK